jgi:hypothetical protein
LAELLGNSYLADSRSNLLTAFLPSLELDVSRLSRSNGHTQCHLKGT